MKVNIKGIIIVLITLFIVDIVFAYGVSPLLAPQVIKVINKNVDPKIAVDSIRVHPVLLGVTLNGVVVSDAEDETMHIFAADKVSLSMNLWKALKKQWSIAQIKVKGAKVMVTQDANGKIELATVNEDEVQKSRLDQLKSMANIGKSDWFTEAFSWVKKTLSKKSEEADASTKKKDALKLKKEVVQTNKGKVIQFKSPDVALLEIGWIEVKDATIVLSSGGQKIPPFENIDLEIKNLKVGDNNAFSLESLRLEGEFATSKRGEFEYDLKFSEGMAKSKLELKQMDLAALAPIYSKSLPVSFTTGYITLTSDSSLQKNKLTSSNDLQITEHKIEKASMLSVGSLIMGPIIEVLNEMKPIKLKFDIGGTPDKPSFAALNQTLLDLAKDKIENSTMSQMKDKAGAGIDKLKEKFGGFLNN